MNIIISINNIVIICWILITQFCYYFYHRDRYKLLKGITKNLENLNIVYVKLFQVITNNSILNKNEQQYLLQYTDKVPYNEKEIDYKNLNNLKQIKDLLIEETPINSGIIALVYKGKYKDKTIVIKILKTGIKQKVILAIKDIELLFYILSFIPYLNNLELNKLLKDNKQLLIDQIDFDNEMRYHSIFYDKLNNIEYIKIPEIYNKLIETNENGLKISDAIIMEYIDGFKIDQIDNEFDKEIFGRLNSRFHLISMFYYNILHSDLHSGNIIFIKNENKYKIGIIDFGLCTFPSRENQLAYYNFTKDFLINKKFTSPIIDSNMIEPTYIKNNITRKEKHKIQEQANIILQNYKNDPINPIIIIKLNTLLKEYNLYYSEEFNQIIFAFISATETSKSLLKDWEKVYSEEVDKINNIINLTILDELF